MSKLGFGKAPAKSEGEEAVDRDNKSKTGFGPAKRYSRSSDASRGRSGGGKFVTKDGRYVFYVEGAYDSYAAYPSDRDKKKCRRIGLVCRVTDVLRTGGGGKKAESDESMESRKDQIGKRLNLAVFVSENSLQTALALLSEIAAGKDEGVGTSGDGAAILWVLPKELHRDFNYEEGFDEQKGQEFVAMDEAKMANEGPFNPSHLVGRFFEGEVSQDGEYMNMNPWRSCGMEEDRVKGYAELEDVEYVGPRNIFEGEDEATAEFLASRKKSGSFSRKNARKKELNPEEKIVPDDDLPY